MTQTIQLGQGTYELYREFEGARPLPELIAERIAQNIPQSQPVDGGNQNEV